MSKTVLVLVETVDDYLPLLEQAGYQLIRAPSPQMRASAIQRHAGQIDACLLYTSDAADDCCRV